MNLFSKVRRKVASKLFNPVNTFADNHLQRREAWLQKTLRSLPAGSRILDAGAGELQYKKFCSHLDYVSQDFGQYDGQGDDAGLQTSGWDNSKLDIISDITNIPVPDESFDAIMCIEVLEHLPNPVLAIKELTRLLRKNGTLIITAPFNSLTHFAPYHFSTGFSKYYYQTHLKEHGYRIEEIVPNTNYFEYIAGEICRTPLVASKYTSKNLTRLQRFYLTQTVSVLQELGEAGDRSTELLCGGYHVRAIKL